MSMFSTGAITNYIDVAQLVLYMFWIFFACVVFYLLRENKREGYPLQSDRSERAPRVAVQGWPAIPQPKTYKLPHGDSVLRPDRRADTRPIAARPVAGFPGAPLEPTGNPMLDGVGPAAWAERAEVPDVTYEGDPKIVPLRVATDHHLDGRDPDPRGKPVWGADGVQGGIVRDLWVDRSEAMIRYLEVTVAAKGGDRNVLLPINFSKVKADGVRVRAIVGSQFAAVPVTVNPNQVTLREEDRIVGYYGGGMLYATPDRQEPLL